MTKPRSVSHFLIATAIVLALSACGKKPEAPAPAAKTPPVTTAPTSAMTHVPSSAPVSDAESIEPKQAGPAVNTSVQNVLMGTGRTPEGQLIGAGKTFSPNDAIYALISTLSYSPTPTPITARWSFEGGQLVSETSQIPELRRNGTALTAFHIEKTDGWPKGRYTLAVMIEGRQAAMTNFEVK